MESISTAVNNNVWWGMDHDANTWITFAPTRPFFFAPRSLSFPALSFSPSQLSFSSSFFPIPPLLSINPSIFYPFTSRTSSVDALSLPTNIHNIINIQTCYIATSKQATLSIYQKTGIEINKYCVLNGFDYWFFKNSRPGLNFNVLVLNQHFKLLQGKKLWHW